VQGESASTQMSTSKKYLSSFFLYPYNFLPALQNVMQRQKYLYYFLKTQNAHKIHITPKILWTMQFGSFMELEICIYFFTFQIEKIINLSDWEIRKSSRLGNP